MPPALLPQRDFGDGQGLVGVVRAADSPITYTHTQPTATNTTGAMLASNTARRYALLQNIGTVDVDIKIGAAAVASQGIRLTANGGSFEMGAVFGNLSTAAINGITASGTAVVLVTEGV